MKFNLLRRRRVEGELAALCIETGLGIAAYSSLSGGTLIGKYLHGVPPGSRGADPAMQFRRDTFVGRERAVIVSALEPICKRARLSARRSSRSPQLPLAWCLRNPLVCTAILGATRVEQLRNNVRAADPLPKVTAESRLASTRPSETTAPMPTRSRARQHKLIK